MIADVPTASDPAGGLDGIPEATTAVTPKPTPTGPRICPDCNLQLLPRGVCGECDS